MADISYTYTVRDNATGETTTLHEATTAGMAEVAGQLATETGTVRAGNYIEGPSTMIQLLVRDYGTPNGHNAYVITQTQHAAPKAQETITEADADFRDWLVAAMDSEEGI